MLGYTIIQGERKAAHVVKLNGKRYIDWLIK